MKNLHHLVVVITGASSGIGLESAKCFAKAGCRIGLLARSADKLEKAAEEVRGLGAEVLALPTDVTDETAVKQTFSTVQATLGPVDILINNAGVGFATDLSKCSMADFRRMMETNVTGVFLCTREVLPGMKERQSGHIINISSIVGKVANPNAPLYCSSKHALNGYNSGLQQQVAADKIRVSLISPSATDTAYWDGRQVDRGKFLKPAEVAEIVFFVASQPEGVLIKDIDLTAFR